MPPINDGPNPSPNELRHGNPTSAGFPDVPNENRYDFMFDNLRRPENLLNPAVPGTIESLIKLGATMVDQNPSDADLDSDIPSAYTYLGQFIDHDVTRQSLVNPPQPNQPPTGPLSLDEIRASSNLRTYGLDLDCVYGPAVETNVAFQIPRNGDQLATDITSGSPFGPELPREQAPPHAALIGDRRNDVNLIVSQLHLAFMLAHNKLVGQGANFEEARRILRRHYQWMVVEDYLRRVADPAVVNAVLDSTINLYDPPDDNMYMPLEFSVAAFRFGHSMIRDSYNYNETFERVHLFQLQLPGFLATYHHIPGEWTINWTRFLDGTNNARRFDTTLARGLLRLTNAQGQVSPFGLATMDLLKGFTMCLPTGEAVANRLGQEMSCRQFQSALTNDQKQILGEGGFEGRTPLWFYILAEANALGNGRLGPVGSVIVASVLIGLVRKSKDSYLRFNNWTPSLGTNGKFDLSDLLRFAEVLPQ